MYCYIIFPAFRARNRAPNESHSSSTAVYIYICSLALYTCLWSPIPSVTQIRGNAARTFPFPTAVRCVPSFLWQGLLSTFGPLCRLAPKCAETHAFFRIIGSFLQIKFSTRTNERWKNAASRQITTTIAEIILLIAMSSIQREYFLHIPDASQISRYTWAAWPHTRLSFLVGFSCPLVVFFLALFLASDISCGIEDSLKKHVIGPSCDHGLDAWRHNHDPNTRITSRPGGLVVNFEHY